MAAQDVAEDEGEHEHGDLQQNPHPGHLLLLPGRRLRQAAARRRRSRGQAQLQRHVPRRPLVSLGRGPVKGLVGAEEVLERRPGSREESEVARVVRGRTARLGGEGQKGPTPRRGECGGLRAVVGPRFLDAYNAGASC